MGSSLKSLLLLAAAAAAAAALLLLGYSADNPWRTAVRPRDLLPLLPRWAAWPILRSLHSAVDLLPTFVGVASSPNTSLTWKGACFYNTSAWMEFHNNSASPFGGGTLHINLRNPHSWTCMDLYVFATPYRVTWDYYFLAREHTLDFKEWEGKAEFEYVKNKGVSIFLMQSGMIGTLRALWDIFPLFTNTGWGENSNLAFLKNHMGASFEQRPQPWVSNFSIDDINSGDFLALSKIRGRWGGFETLEKWVTGAYAGHTAVCLKDSEGKLWVGESGHENEKGEDIIAVLPWDEWWDFEVNKDDSNPQIALLPLHPDIRAKFNETAAWEYARSMSGKPYGYHNMIFSWIDTIRGNYPPPLDAHLALDTCRESPPSDWPAAAYILVGREDLAMTCLGTSRKENGSQDSVNLTSISVPYMRHMQPVNTTSPTSDVIGQSSVKPEDTDSAYTAEDGMEHIFNSGTQLCYGRDLRLNEICEKSLNSMQGGPSMPPVQPFVRTEMLASGYLIRPCDGCG